MDICKHMSEEEKRGFWEKWRYKYRFVILNSDNFEERLSFKLSRLNVFVLGSFALVILIGGTALLISLTLFENIFRDIPQQTCEDKWLS